MNSQTRVEAMFRGEAVDRIPVFEHYWSEAIDRWRGEGLPADVDPADHFDLDMRPLPWPNLTFRFPEETLEEDEKYIVIRDANGITARRHKTESGHTPHWIDWMIRGREDWERYRERLAWSDDRLPDELDEKYREARAANRFTLFAAADPYECAWPIFGQVRIFELMLDDPALIGEVFALYADRLIEAAAAMLDRGIDFDGAWFYGDVGYRGGLLFSPQIYDELLWPQHRKICEFFRSRGKPVTLHSCGKVKSLIPRFIEAGFAALNPIEAKCDQDLRDLHPRYGDELVWVGNFDVRALSGSPSEIEEEVESKIRFVREQGGRLIFHSDHSVPQTVSYEAYSYALELARAWS